MACSFSQSNSSRPRRRQSSPSSFRGMTQCPCCPSAPARLIRRRAPASRASLQATGCLPTGGSCRRCRWWSARERARCATTTACPMARCAPRSPLLSGTPTACTTRRAPRSLPSSRPCTAWRRRSRAERRCSPRRAEASNSCPRRSVVAHEASPQSSTGASVRWSPAARARLMSVLQTARRRRRPSPRPTVSRWWRKTCAGERRCTPWRPPSRAACSRRTARPSALRRDRRYSMRCCAPRCACRRRRTRWRTTARRRRAARTARVSGRCRTTARRPSLRRPTCTRTAGGWGTSWSGTTGRCCTRLRRRRGTRGAAPASSTAYACRRARPSCPRPLRPPPRRRSCASSAGCTRRSSCSCAARSRTHKRCSLSRRLPCCSCPPPRRCCSRRSSSSSSARRRRGCLR
mmetsp:Transcript_40325/g.130527  ORF Transcript_40325/g.130527 Transcript_40325/m.130527 type:complete len:404 (-) Transcript_40325:135-1346(-)